MNRWTKEWPTKVGKYWFYGWAYGRFYGVDRIPVNPELSLVKVRKCSNGIIYAREGNFWSKSEGGVGMFRKVDLPRLPDVSGMVPKEKK